MTFPRGLAPQRARRRISITDRTRIGADDRVGERLFGDPIQLILADAHILQRPRQPQITDEGGHRVGRAVSRASERGGDVALTGRRRRLVPAHHRRQHHAGGVAVRDPGDRAQHIADAVAGAHRNPAEAGGGEPHGLL
jgi:hypothetical protein